MVEDVDVGLDKRVPERVLLKWLSLAWKSASSGNIDWQDIVLIVVLILSVVNIIVGFLPI